MSGIRQVGPRRATAFFALAAAGGALLSSAGPAQAQERSASAQAMLEEIVVTARRREESLQSLPLSIAAINAEAMQAQGVYNIEDAGEFIPNLTLAQADRANETRVIIRGIGGGHGDPVLSFGTGMYIDGHYIPSSLGGFMSTLDIERIEVLRGPQGTLFGKNTTGGAVNIITTKPSPDFEVDLTLRAAEFGQQDVRGTVNVPLGENVFARISAASQQMDGYYYNRNLDNWVDYRNLDAFTGMLRFTPGDHWTVDFTAMVSEQRDGNVGGQCRPHPDAPGWGSEPGHVERIYPGATADFHQECLDSVAMGPYVQSSEKLQYSNVDQESAFLSALWDSAGPLGGLDAASIRLTSSYRFVTYRWLRDADRTSLPIDTFAQLGPKGQYNRTRNFELVFEADANDRLQFTTGLNYFTEDGNNGPDNCFHLFVHGLNGQGPFDPNNPQDLICEPAYGFLFEFLPPPRADMGGPAPSLAQIRVSNESTGIFGHLTYALNDNWDLDVGARYTKDERYFTNIEFAVQDCFWTENPTGACSPTAVLNAETVLEGGFLNEADGEWSEVTPMISLTRNLAGGDRLDSGMYYILYSEGFLTGGFNTEINVINEPVLEPLLRYGPEHVSNYEFGFKGTFNGGNLRLNTAVFYMDYTDKQDSVNLDNSDFRFGPDPTVGIVTNVSEVEIYGLEVELRASPWAGGFVSADLGYLHNEYADYVTLNPETLDPEDLSNANISDLSPEWTLQTSVEHAFDLANGGTLTPMVGVYWQSGYEYLGNLTRDAPESYCYQDAYAKWRTRLTYTPPEGNYELALFGYNITDERILESCANGRAHVFHYRYERPETWGVEFNVNFGPN